MTKLVRKGADQGWVQLFIRIEEINFELWIFYKEYIIKFAPSSLNSGSENIFFHKIYNRFLRTVSCISLLSGGSIICTIGIIVLYPKIIHEKVLAYLRRFKVVTTDKNAITGSLVNLKEIVWKNNIFYFRKKLLH